MHAREIDVLDTPAVVVDLERVEANILRLQRLLDDVGVANRPHIKTHKIPEIARQQVAAGAIGIACQKVSEAEVMVGAGLEDIMIPYNIVGEVKLQRLMELARRTHLSVTADSPFTARGYSGAAQKAGLELDVLVEFDTGGHRCGVQSPAEAAETARLIDRLPGLRFAGLMTFPHNAYSDLFVRETRRLLAGEGLDVRCVSYGGTPQMWQIRQRTEATEYRAGTYIYGDRATIRSGAMTAAQCALHVIATVVSRPTADRGVLDAGSKTLTSDLLGFDTYGLILEYPRAHLYALSEEHGHVDFSQCRRKPEIGERVTILPNHVCPVSNLVDEVIGIRHGRVEVLWPVAARGKVR